MNGKVIPVFLGMLTWHVAHILEEVWGLKVMPRPSLARMPS